MKKGNSMEGHINKKIMMMATPKDEKRITK
jgi:hypothetical protein